MVLGLGLCRRKSILSTHPELQKNRCAVWVKNENLCIDNYWLYFGLALFCKVMCPFGVIYGLLNKISIYHLEVNKDRCVNCEKCAKICKMDIALVKTPDSEEGIRCGECAAACPAKAIHIGFGSEQKT